MTYADGAGELTAKLLKLGLSKRAPRRTTERLRAATLAERRRLRRELSDAVTNLVRLENSGAEADSTSAKSTQISGDKRPIFQDEHSALNRWLSMVGRPSEPKQAASRGWQNL